MHLHLRVSCPCLYSEKLTTRGPHLKAIRPTVLLQRRTNANLRYIKTLTSVVSLRPHLVGGIPPPSRKTLRPLPLRLETATGCARPASETSVRTPEAINRQKATQGSLNGIKAGIPASLLGLCPTSCPDCRHMLGHLPCEHRAGTPRSPPDAIPKHARPCAEFASPARR